jgi:2-succinyl-6-hydroxy-2,4-cyclohexadiene-1-carboxylate synthase
MGGRIALHYALGHPDRVSRLVLESASPGLSDPRDRAARVASDEALARALEADGIEGFVNRWEALPLFESQQALPEAVRAEVRRRRLTNDPRSLAASLRGIGTGTLPSLWDRLEEVAQPVLLLVGALDSRFVTIARRMAARLPTAEVHVVGGAGHRVHLERPREWLEAVTRFLTDSSGR